MASMSVEEHGFHLREVLQGLQQHGLVLNCEKCVVGASQVEYLGHCVAACGVSPLEERVTAIQKHPAPNTVQQL